MTEQQQVPTLVIAGSYAMFRGWCLDNGRNPRDRSLVYVTDAHVLYGYRDINVVWGPGAGRRSDYAKLRDLVARIEAQGRSEVVREAEGLIGGSDQGNA